MKTHDHELDVISCLARDAGRAILEIYASDFSVRYKGQNDPVTDADLKAEEIIASGLSREFPSDGIVSEESPVTEDARSKPRVWYVDPLDGTGEFVARTGEFVVMIGLVERGRSVCGVIYRPIGDVLYAGRRDHTTTIVTGEQRTTASVSRNGQFDPLRLAVSRSHRHPVIDEVKNKLGNVLEIPCGSVGAKVGLLIAGLTDVYIEPSTYTSKWDVCGPEAVLAGAGGCLTDLDGCPIHYDTSEMKNRRGFVATNHAWHRQILDAIPASYLNRLREIPNRL